MANLKLNSALKGLRGRVDDWVYRKVGTRMVISPVSDAPRPPLTVAQLEAQNRFRQAASYAKTVMSNPVARLACELVSAAREVPVFAVAIKDYYTPPIVHIIDASEYHGAVGQKIKVLASDDVEVMSLDVAICDANGVIIEQGAAMKVKDEWFYTATFVVPAATPVKIKAMAKDRPGNEAFLEKDHIT